MHIIILHAPIGLMIGLVMLEVLGVIRKRDLAGEARMPLAMLLAVSAIAAVVSGLVLSRGETQESATLQLHKFLGIATGVSTLAAAVLLMMKKQQGYRAALVLGALLIGPAGHFGGSMTHGEDFITKPLFGPSRKPVTPTDKPSEKPTNMPTGPNGAGATDRPSGDGGTPNKPTGAGETIVFARDIQPIFASKCYSCHGETKHKGGLALNTIEDIRAGGKGGAVIVAGNAAKSELMVRLLLPLEEDGHMPPSDKTQLQPGEIELIERWIKAGAAM